MTGDISQIGQKTAEEITQSILLEVVKRVSIDSGDILVVRVKDDDVFEQFRTLLQAANPDKKFLLVNQEHADVIREMADEEMAELGWVRANTAKEIKEARDALSESE